MKANEIMIGDFVNLMDANPEYNESDYFGQVDELNTANDIIWHKDEPYSIKMSEPIPLTKEMLEHNGFDYLNDGMNSEWYHCKFSIEEREPYDGLQEFEWNGVIFKYVHELQHILRICGLNELANNFKLE